MQQPSFPVDPHTAIIEGFAQAERQFIEGSEGKTQNQIKGDKSGSCAIIAMLIDDMCYIANVGDSRAILSSQNGSMITALSTDHKPDDPVEFSRITSNGGTIYQ